MALKLENKCTRCGRVTSTEVQNFAEAAKVEETEAKRAAVVNDIKQFLAGIPPEHLPDLFIVRRGQEHVVQTYLCEDEDAKRACAKRVDTLVDECKTFDPRKPKTKKPADAPAAPEAPAEPAAAPTPTTPKKNDKTNTAAKQ